MTYRTYCVERSHSFFYFLPNNDRVKQLPVATKVWLFLVLDLSSRAKNMLESSTETFINIANAYSSCRDRSLDGKLDRGLDSRPNTYPDVIAKARPHYYQQSHRSMISTERILAFGFQWPDSVTCLLPPNSRKRALTCFQSSGECAWMASIMLFRIMVWDVHPIIYLHPTTEKEKVLLPLRNNREESTTSTQSSLQVQRVSVPRMTPERSTALILWSSDFFFWFSAKSYTGGWRET